MQVKNKLQ